MSANESLVIALGLSMLLNIVLSIGLGVSVPAPLVKLAMSAARPIVLTTPTKIDDEALAAIEAAARSQTNK